MTEPEKTEDLTNLSKDQLIQMLIEVRKENESSPELY